MKNSMQNMKFKTQLYFAFSVVIILVSLLILFGLYTIQWANYREQASITLQNQAKQIAINIDNKMDYYTSFTNILVQNSSLIHALENNNYNVAKNLLNIESNKLLNLNIGKVNGIYLHHSYQNKADENKKFDKAINDYFKDNAELVWTETHLNERNEKVFSMYQRIFQTNLNEEYYIEICIYETEILAFFNKNHSGYRISVVNNDLLISSSDREYFNKTLQLQRKTGLIMPQNVSEQAKLNAIHVSAKCKTGWEVIIDSDMRYITKNFREGFLGIIPVILISMVVAFMYISLISRRLSKRMNRLHKKIDYISQWDFTKDLRMGGNDEFRILSDALDETRQRILNLITQINQTNELKRVAEMTALRSQIKSHFLFNSLSTIKWLSRQNNQSALSEAVDKLSYILRYSLSLDENYASLSSEVEHLQAYIYLEKLRYHEGVMVHIDIEQELMSYKTVKLILQPLVENSIYHGRREDGATLNITIYSYCDEENYYLVVEDDGNGMSTEKICEISNSECKGNEDGYGLKNVINRLRMCSGNMEALVIQSKSQFYTKITICQSKT